MYAIQRRYTIPATADYLDSEAIVVDALHVMLVDVHLCMARLTRVQSTTFPTPRFRLRVDRLRGDGDSHLRHKYPVDTTVWLAMNGLPNCDKVIAHWSRGRKG